MEKDNRNKDQQGPDQGRQQNNAPEDPTRQSRSADDRESVPTQAGPDGPTSDADALEDDDEMDQDRDDDTRTTGEGGTNRRNNIS